MIIDCGRCVERTDECTGCLISVLDQTPVLRLPVSVLFPTVVTVLERPA